MWSLYCFQSLYLLIKSTFEIIRARETIQIKTKEKIKSKMKRHQFNRIERDIAVFLDFLSYNI